MSYRYPVYRPHFTGREREFVLDCIDSTWISSKGRYINEFEQRFAAYAGVRHALSVSNGTVALHVALDAVGIGAGDEVLVPTLTYIASANAVAYTGAKPVFVDSEAAYWQIDMRDAERRLTPATKAIMPVHLYGQACDMDAVMDFAARHRLLVIEDCAEAIGTRYKGRHVGTFGHVSTFSFFGNKTVTTGEGGMVVCNDDAVAAKISTLKGQGLSKDREYWHDVVGYNYRMTNICAAIGCAQMEAVDRIVETKQAIAAWYREGLEGLPVTMHATRNDTFHSYWMVSILTDRPADRDPLRAALKEAGIETRPLFNPIHLMPMHGQPRGRFPVAEDLAQRGINLPSYPDLTRQDVQAICAETRAFFASRAR